MDHSTLGMRDWDTGRNLALDGLRGFAALAVVFAHLVTYTGLSPFPPMGIMGVIMFFVLSGYLIGRILWRTEPTVSSYVTFVRRRVRRLAPALTAVVAAGSAALWALGTLPTPGVLREGAAALLQLTAFREASQTEVAVIFRPSWSLTVEWTFYLLCPLAIFALKRFDVDARRSSMILGCGALALYALALPLPAVAFYHLPVANLGVLAAGAALAVGHVDRELNGPAPSMDPAYSAMAMVMLAILVVLPGDALSLAWKLCVLPAAAVATLVVTHGCWAGVTTARLLSAGWLRAVGVRSYSLYLWHLPVMWLVGEAVPGSSPMARAGIALVATVPLVAISYHLLEAPMLSRPVRVPGRLPLARPTAERAARPGPAGRAVRVALR